MLSHRCGGLAIPSTPLVLLKTHLPDLAGEPARVFSVKTQVMPVPGLSFYLWQRGEKLSFAKLTLQILSLPPSSRNPTPTDVRSSRLHVKYFGKGSWQVGKQMLFKMLMLALILWSFAREL